jgi:hypothetical protein
MRLTEVFQEVAGHDLVGHLSVKAQTTEDTVMIITNEEIGGAQGATIRGLGLIRDQIGWVVDTMQNAQDQISERNRRRPSSDGPSDVDERGTNASEIVEGKLTIWP